MKGVRVAHRKCGPEPRPAREQVRSLRPRLDTGTAPLTQADLVSFMLLDRKQTLSPLCYFIANTPDLLYASLLQTNLISFMLLYRKQTLSFYAALPQTNLISFYASLSQTNLIFYAAFIANKPYLLLLYRKQTLSPLSLSQTNLISFMLRYRIQT